nr:reverse transcriptase domain-containing protein [Tanacetum cinerariifolium]
VKDNKEKDKIRAKSDKIKSKQKAWKSPDSSPTKSKPIQNQESIKPRWENDPGKLGTAPDLIERLASDQSSNSTSSMNPKGRNRRRSKQRIVNSNLEEHSHFVVTMADQRTMAELLRAPTEGGSLPVARKRTLSNYSHFGGSCFKIHQRILSLSRTTNLRNEISNFQQRFDKSFHEAWDRYKDLLRACLYHGFIELHQLDTFYNALNPADQDSLNAAAGGNLMERSTQDVLTIIKNKSKVRNSRSKLVVSQVKSCDVNSNSSSEIVKLTHAVNQQTSVVTTAMTAMLKQFLATSPPAPVKAVEETCVTCGGAHPYYQCLAASGNTFPELRDNIQGYISAAVVNYNQGNPGYHPQKMLKALLSNKEKLQELANTPLNENCSAVILKKLPKKLGDPRKFLISCGFSKLKCKALANLGVVWKKLGLPELIPTRMTLELANHAICTPAGIARDVFILVGKFTFPSDFVIVDYESDPRVPFILGRPFLRTARTLIDVHGEEMILRDGDERLTLNMRHDTSS